MVLDWRLEAGCKRLEISLETALGDIVSIWHAMVLLPELRWSGAIKMRSKNVSSRQSAAATNRPGINNDQVDLATQIS